MRDLEDVDRVLAGLGAVEPGAGMEARVMLALAQPELRQQGVRQGEFWPWVSARRLTVVGGVASVLLMMSPLVTHTTRHGAARRTAGVMSSIKAVSPAMPAAVATLESKPPAAEHRTGNGVGDTSAVRRLRSGPVGARPNLPVAPVSQSALAAQVESFPAPPMPLTRQERLLLRMLQGGAATELVATLGPGAERAVRSKEHAEFSEFFQQAVPAKAEVLRDTGLEDGGVTGEAAVGGSADDKHGRERR